MSFTWPNKDPDEQLDYSVDWSRFLDTATISNVEWFVKSNSYNTNTIFIHKNKIIKIKLNC